VAARLVEGLRLLETAEVRLPVAVSELHVDPARGFILRTVPLVVKRRPGWTTPRSLRLHPATPSPSGGYPPVALPTPSPSGGRPPHTQPIGRVPGGYPAGTRGPGQGPERELAGSPGSQGLPGVARAPADEGLTLVVGEAPFGPKVDRLERILDYLAATGEAAERVDLTLGSRAVVRLRVPRPAGAWRTTGAPAEPTDPGAAGTRPLPGSPGNSVARGGEAGEAEASRGGPPRGGSIGPSWIGQPRSGSGSRSESL
jgi:hypothetical protein